MRRRPNFVIYRPADMQFEMGRLDKTCDLRWEVLKEDVDDLKWDNDDVSFQSEETSDLRKKWGK